MLIQLNRALDGWSVYIGARDRTAFSARQGSAASVNYHDVGPVKRNVNRREYAVIGDFLEPPLSNQLYIQA